MQLIDPLRVTTHVFITQTSNTKRQAKTIINLTQECQKSLSHGAFHFSTSNFFIHIIHTMFVIVTVSYLIRLLVYLPKKKQLNYKVYQNFTSRLDYINNTLSVKLYPCDHFIYQSYFGDIFSELDTKLRPAARAPTNKMLSFNRELNLLTV